MLLEAANARADRAEARVAWLEGEMGVKLARVAELEAELDAKHAQLVEVADRARARIAEVEAAVLVAAADTIALRATVRGAWEQVKVLAVAYGAFASERAATEAIAALDAQVRAEERGRS